MKAILLHFMFLCIAFSAKAQFQGIGFDASQIKKQFKGELIEKQSASGQIYFSAKDVDNRYSYRMFLGDNAICNRIIIIPTSKEDLDKFVQQAKKNYTSISDTQWQTLLNKNETSVKLDVMGGQSVLVYELLAKN